MSGYQSSQGVGKGGGYQTVGGDGDNRSCWKRIPTRWKWLPLDMAGGIPLLIGVAFFNDCGALPELTLMLTLMGGMGLANAFVKFGFTLPHDFDKQDHFTWRQLVSHVLTFLVFGMACALGVETFGQTYRLKDGGWNCVKQPYQCGFLAALINMTLLLGIYGYYACRRLYRAVRGGPASDSGRTYLSIGRQSQGYVTV